MSGCSALCQESDLGREKLAAGLLPPPTIEDVTAVLDSEKPDLATLAKLRAAASREPANNLTQEELAQFYYARSEARGILGRTSEALSDGQEAFAAAERAHNVPLWMRIGMHNLGWARSAGDLKSGLAAIERMIAEADRSQTRGNLFPLHHTAAKFAAELGDMRTAEEHLRIGHTLIAEARQSGANPA